MGASCWLHGAINCVRDRLVLVSFPISIAGALLPLFQGMSLLHRHGWGFSLHPSELLHPQYPPRLCLHHDLIPSTLWRRKIAGPSPARVCWGWRHGCASLAAAARRWWVPALGTHRLTWSEGWVLPALPAPLPTGGGRCSPLPRAAQLQHGAAAYTSQKPPGGSETATSPSGEARGVYIFGRLFLVLAGKAPRTAVAACANGRRRWLGGERLLPGDVFPLDAENKLRKVPAASLWIRCAGGRRSAPARSCEMRQCRSGVPRVWPRSRGGWAAPSQELPQPLLARAVRQPLGGWPLFLSGDRLLG